MRSRQKAYRSRPLQFASRLDMSSLRHGGPPPVSGRRAAGSRQVAAGARSSDVETAGGAAAPVRLDEVERPQQAIQPAEDAQVALQVLQLLAAQRAGGERFVCWPVKGQSSLLLRLAAPLAVPPMVQPACQAGLG